MTRFSTHLRAVALLVTAQAVMLTLPALVHFALENFANFASSLFVLLLVATGAAIRANGNAWLAAVGLVATWLLIEPFCDTPAFATLGPAALGVLWVALDINRRQRHRTWLAQWALLGRGTRNAMAERRGAWLAAVVLAAAALLVDAFGPPAKSFGSHDVPGTDKLCLILGGSLSIAAILVGLRILVATGRAIAGELGRDWPVHR
jgi:hypothetical protein